MPTTITQTTTAPCPDWCEEKLAHEFGTLVVDTNRELRTHSVAAGSLYADGPAGRKAETVYVDIVAEDERDAEDGGNRVLGEPVIALSPATPT